MSDLIVDEKLPLLKPVKVSVCVRSLAVACTYAHTHTSRYVRQSLLSRLLGVIWQRASFETALSGVMAQLYASF